jgi:hypothetical protein
MSIIAQCACGNRMAVVNAMAGKNIICSKCDDHILVPQPSVPPAGKKAAGKKTAGKNADATPAIHISPGLITAAVVIVVLLVIVLSLYLGPWTVSNKWAAMQPKASDAVTDVVQFSIQAWESEHGMYDASKSHMVPMTDGPVIWIAPIAMSMPRTVGFSGKTNQGNYVGNYDTTTGEVSVDIQTGGYTVGALVDVKKATGTFHATGTSKDGKVQAECDGKPLVIVMSKSVDKE